MTLNFHNISIANAKVNQLLIKIAMVKKITWGLNGDLKAFSKSTVELLLRYKVLVKVLISFRLKFFGF